ncbi:hypothetical protein CKN82_01530 [Carnobacterium divergens]|uniref:Uncharacterized protein n=1 Tax=Carnobacterium divergens DSM 20623 TaxID=1449336 RepID=A0A0R2HX37_CARDV|nr:hypothetical protein [Carnobacterium divergens]ANZ99385.1 hypothetical protein BFC22_04385 [Carnobacterium divergens]KRN57328.1 hypothetical protein IV74_GL000310 [Carnobacterium divergens DSM 20623]MDO0875348.1 hypothetical protein [Carnobacterium divergens]MDT1995804.1 hypothetical protein [Carnobacterium divergens]TFI68429.1 hypothetical protein CKN59_01670 [Carnobacterium divergens]
MFEVVNIEERMMDRDIELKNIVTNKVEKCFDNSIGYSDDNNFSFMKIGLKYECKILLIGDQPKEETDDSTKFLLAEDLLVKVGQSKFIKVYLNEDEYYILNEGLSIKKGDKYILFDFFRKDLLEVDGHISPMHT